MKHVGAGIGLTVVIAGVIWAVEGRAAAQAAAVFGLVAVAVHGGAVALLIPALEPPFERLWKRWAMGLGLRLAGITLLATVLFTARDRFPPLPAAVGFLGVLIPLLFGEMRMLLAAMKTDGKK